MTTPRFSPNSSRRTSPILCIVVHWTGGSYASARDWCLRDESDVSYHELLGRVPGEWCELVPVDRAAWSVGHARSDDDRIAFGNGNQASWNIALSGAPPIRPTEWQVGTLIERLAVRMPQFGWGAEDVWRIRGHGQLAVFGPTHARAGQRGRKDDPEGRAWMARERQAGRPAAPWIDLANLRACVADALRARAAA